MPHGQCHIGDADFDPLDLERGRHKTRGIDLVANGVGAVRTSRSFTTLVTDDPFADLSVERSVLEPIGCAVLAHDPGARLSDAVERADALLVGRAVIDEALIARAPKLKVIARYGVGVENIDLDAAARHGVTVVNVPDYCVDEVAEHVIAQMLACARQLVRLNQVIAAGRWSPSDIRPTRRLAGQTLGLIGMGRIGRKVAVRASALGLHIVAYDPYAVSVPETIELTPLDDLLDRADFVSLHVPLTAQTVGVLGAREFARMKDSAFVLNSARGGLIDENALAFALREGKIAGAALDVLEVEPPTKGHPLVGLENVILTPHVAFYSEESLHERKHKASLGVRDVLLGRTPDSAVSAEPGVDRVSP